mgnify:CR=1 FL=1|jgi:hypothetical protein
MDDLITCEKCKREWDGNAQCPCGLYEYELDNMDEIQKIVLNLQSYLFINNKKIDTEIYNHILNNIIKIYNYSS